MLYSHYLCTSHWVETSKHHCHLMTVRTLRHQKKKSRKTSLQNRQFLTSFSISYLSLLTQLWNDNNAKIVLTIFVRPKSDHCLPLPVTNYFLLLRLRDRSRKKIFSLREGFNEKKRFLSGIARLRGGGGLPMPEFFGPLSRSAFGQ